MKNELSIKLQDFYCSDKFLWIIISVGIILRLIRYLYNPSLWFDEAANATYFLEQNITDFIHPSPLNIQSSPVGFLILVKGATQLFGSSEYALKLIPLLYGISALFLFYWVARYYIKPKAVPIALGLFAILDPMVYFSSELKAYSGDLAIALSLYLATSYMQSRKITNYHALFFGFWGVIAIWCSNPAVFILTGIGITFTIFYSMNKEWAVLKKLSFSFALWALSFLTYYFTFVRQVMINFSTLTNNDLFWAKQKAFMPLPPRSLSDIQWFLEFPSMILNHPIGVTFTGLALFTFIVGAVVLYKEQKDRFFIFVLPVIITLLASSFKMYAFASAQILFITPAVLLFIAEGVEHIREKTSQNSSLVWIVLVVLLFIHPSATAVYHIKKPFSREEIKPVLSYVRSNWQEGDVLYLYYMSLRAFDYYSKYYPDYYFKENEYISGRAPQDWYSLYRRKEFKGWWDKDRPFMQPNSDILREYTEDLDKLRGRKRVWVLFSSIVNKGGILEENYFIYYLDRLGKQIDSFGKVANASVYLYDLSGK